MRVLVTGAAGQLGMCLAAALQEVSWIELLLVNRRQLDITDAQQVDAYIRKNNPDVVINTAAFTAVDDAELVPFEVDLVNHIGAANLASASANINAVIIQLSTDYVFSGDSLTPYVESDCALPINKYGCTKLAGEVAVMQLNPKHLILRTAWLFGGAGKNFYSTIAQLLTIKSTINVVNDQVGAPTYIADVAALILNVITKLNKQKVLNWGVYHYSGHPYVTWFDFAKAIQGSLAADVSQCEILGVSTEVYAARARRPRYSCLNSFKACDYFDVKPSAWKYALNILATKSSRV